MGSLIKADIGSIGGHTEPSVEMLDVPWEGLVKSRRKGQITGYDVTHTADDLCLLMVLAHGSDSPRIFVWDRTRLKAQRKAEEIRQQGFAGPTMLPTQEL